MPDKPPYHVPTMAEINELRWNGLTAASTFSGCGGSSLGYRMAGFKVLYANEFVPAARETYIANAAPHTVLDDRDIRDVQPADVLNAIGLNAGELDLLDGSPPCASFSTAGKREAGWGKVKKYSDTEQRTDDLFYEYARLLRGIQPRTFVAENVSGLVKGTAKGYFLRILAELRSCGYRVEARVLSAQWLGVPQARQRLIFVGVREDLDRAPAFPPPLPYCYTVADALPWIAKVGQNDYTVSGADITATMRPAADEPSPTITTRYPRSGSGLGFVIHDTSGQFGAGDITDRPSPTVTGGVNSLNSRHFQIYDGGVPIDPETGKDISISRFAIGREWNALAPGENSDRYLNLARAHEHQPSPTVTAVGGSVAAAGVTHPSQPRKFTLGELRRICGFPDDFVLTGTYEQRWERLGRAVPPVMMAHIAAAVRDGILL
jgi:DNA (cytosine-5)-methyltransferase 1